VRSTIRHDQRGFTDAQMALVEAFAAQAVIAIENARLFEEIQAASRELEDATRHKSAFISSMSHELRTSLNAILGYSEMLQEEAEELGQETMVADPGKVNAAGKHLLSLINNILNLSKIEAGRMDLSLETFDMTALARDIAAVVQPLVEKDGNTLTLTCPAAIGSMYADLTKVRQSLLTCSAMPRSSPSRAASPWTWRSIRAKSRTGSPSWWRTPASASRRRSRGGCSRRLHRRARTRRPATAAPAWGWRSRGSSAA